MGTALTEDQIRNLWRLAPEPVLCFDGDAAGRRAAFRAVETVLPHLAPGRSVVFAFLPEGVDPDDLVRQQGGTAIEGTLKATRPLVDVLWQKELTTRPVDTPERRAAFERRLEQLVLQIRDSKVQAMYRREFRDRLWQFWRERRQTKKTHRLTVSETSSDETLLLALVANPWLLDEFSDDIIRFDFKSEAYSRVLTFIMQLHSECDELDSLALDAAIRASHFAPLVEHLTKNSGHKGVSFVRRAADAESVRLEFSAFLRGSRLHVLKSEVERLQGLLEKEPTEDLLRQLTNLQKEVSAVETRAGTGSEDSGIGGRDLGQFLKELFAANHKRPIGLG
jgi:DNA primase